MLEGLGPPRESAPPAARAGAPGAGPKSFADAARAEHGAERSLFRSLLLGGLSKPRAGGA